MVDTEKKTSAERSGGSDRPREGSSRADAGPTKGGQRNKQQESQGRRPSRSAGSKTPPRSSESGSAARGERGRVHAASGTGPRRPRDVKAGSGARMIAPIALVICAIAVFVVLTSQESGSSKTPVGEASSSVTNSSGSSTTEAPTGPKRSRYTVKAGDSFSAIAEAQGVDIATLQELNPDIDPRALQPGQRLKLKE